MLTKIIIILLLLPSLSYAGDMFDYKINDNYVYNFEKLVKEKTKSTMYGCTFFPSIKKLEYDIDIIDKDKTFYRLHNDMGSLFRDNILYSILYPFYICRF